MLSNRADSVSLADGDIAHLMIGGTLRPLTRQPLAAGQLVALLREMAPPHVTHQLAVGGPLEFIYANDEGKFVTRVRIDDGRMLATVSLAPAANGSNGSAAGTSSRNGSALHASNGGNGAEPKVALAALAAAEEAETASTKEAQKLKVAAITVDVDPSPYTAKDEIDGLLKALVDQSASDLHLRVGEPPILRIHGELKRMRGMEPVRGARLESMLAAIMPERNLAEYREINDTDFAYEIEGFARFRANAFRDHTGAGGVFRVIPAKVATVEALGVTPEVQNLCFLTKGLVLVTGPTGSGKSTTLGALIDLINRSRDDHVVTIEDPIEFVHKNKRCVITQRQVGLHTASFKSALRAALREDPDIVLVGEMRDLETVSIALETAETGHLVFGTLHTTTAVGTIDRIIDQFPPDRQAQIRVMLADTLKGVISQTLCKKIGGGRVAAREILLSVPAVSNLIREAKAFQLQSVMQTSRKLGMVLLGDVLIEMVDNGVVEPKEAYMKSTDKVAFLNALKNRGHDVSFTMV